MLPATTANSGQPPLIRSIALITPAEWPCAVSMATASTPRLDECLDPLEIVTDTNGCGTAQSSGVVAAGVGKLLALLDVLHRDQSAEPIAAVDERQLPMRWRWRIALASSSDVPTGAVTSPVDVMNSEIGRS